MCAATSRTLRVFHESGEGKHWAQMNRPDPLAGRFYFGANHSTRAPCASHPAEPRRRPYIGASRTARDPRPQEHDVLGHQPEHPIEVPGHGGASPGFDEVSNRLFVARHGTPSDHTVMGWVKEPPARASSTRRGDGVNRSPFSAASAESFEA